MYDCIVLSSNLDSITILDQRWERKLSSDPRHLKRRLVLFFVYTVPFEATATAAAAAVVVINKEKICFYKYTRTHKPKDSHFSMRELGIDKGVRAPKLCTIWRRRRRHLITVVILVTIAKFPSWKSDTSLRGLKRFILLQSSVFLILLVILFAGYDFGLSGVTWMIWVSGGWCTTRPNSYPWNIQVILLCLIYHLLHSLKLNQFLMELMKFRALLCYVCVQLGCNCIEIQRQNDKTMQEEVGLLFIFFFGKRRKN